VPKRLDAKGKKEQQSGSVELAVKKVKTPFRDFHQESSTLDNPLQSTDNELQSFGIIIPFKRKTETKIST